MFRKRFPWLLLFLLVVSLLLPSCASSKQEALPDLEKIQIGYLPTLGYSAFFLAEEKGYFKEQGLEVELTMFKSGSEMIVPLSTGQLDVGAGEPGTALFNAVAQDLDIKVVCGFSAQAPGHGSSPALVRKDLFDSGEVSQPGDLAGRKIGVNVPRGMVEYTVAKILEKADLTVDDVELVPIPFPDMPAALANSAVDLVVLPHPSAAKAINDGSAVVFMGGDEIAGTIQNGVMYFGQRLLDPANREIAMRFMVAFIKAAREIQGDGWKTDENVNFINSYTNLPPEIITSSIRSYADPDCKLIYDSLMDVQDYYISRSYTDYSELIPPSEFANEEFAKEAVSRLNK